MLQYMPHKNVKNAVLKLNCLFANIAAAKEVWVLIRLMQGADAISAEKAVRDVYSGFPGEGADV